MTPTGQFLELFHQFRGYFLGCGRIATDLAFERTLIVEPPADTEQRELRFRSVDRV